MVDKQFELASARWVVENSVEQVTERAYTLDEILSTLYYTHWPDPQLTYKYTKGVIEGDEEFGFGMLVPPSVKIGVLRSIYVEGYIKDTHENSRVALETALKYKQDEPA